MAPESEDDRINRIREAQIGSRGGSGEGLKPRASAKSNSQPKSKKQVSLPTKSKIKLPVLPIIRANTRANAVHDIVVGVGISILPAILAFVFLPGGFKLLGVLILLGGGVGGFLLGETAS
jgi:hypothetical protein